MRIKILAHSHHSRIKANITPDITDKVWIKERSIIKNKKLIVFSFFPAIDRFHDYTTMSLCDTELHFRFLSRSRPQPVPKSTSQGGLAYGVPRPVDSVSVLATRKVPRNSLLDVLCSNSVDNHLMSGLVWVCAIVTRQLVSTRIQWIRSKSGSQRILWIILSKLMRVSVR